MRRADELKDIQYKLFTDPINKSILCELERLGGYMLVSQLFDYLSITNKIDMNYKSYSKRIKKLADNDIVETQRIEKNNVICLKGDYYRLLNVSKNKPVIRSRVLEDRTSFLDIFLQMDGHHFPNSLQHLDHFKAKKIFLKHNTMVILNQSAKEMHVFLCLERRDTAKKILKKIDDLNANINGLKVHYYVIVKDEIEAKKGSKIAEYVANHRLYDVTCFETFVRERYFAGKTLL